MTKSVAGKIQSIPKRSDIFATAFKKTFDELMAEERKILPKNADLQQYLDNQIILKEEAKVIHNESDETQNIIRAISATIRGMYEIDDEERPMAAGQLNATLAVKEILLREVHHRMKNNLQVVSSILSLQAGTDNRSRDALKECQRRVKVMAQIHEDLHQIDDLASLNARDYLNTVIGDTLASGGHDAQRISSRLEVDDIVIDVDQAVACGHIVSELLSNSQKHAFPDGQSGNIVVSLHRRDEGRIELTVADDGKGLAQDFDLEQAETLGMRLVHALAMQLSGVIEVDVSGGTRVQIIFPEQP